MIGSCEIEMCNEETCIPIGYSYSYPNLPWSGTGVTTYTWTYELANL